MKKLLLILLLINSLFAVTNQNKNPEVILVKWLGDGAMLQVSIIPAIAINYAATYHEYQNYINNSIKSRNCQ
jgi:hypothetical protein